MAKVDWQCIEILNWDKYNGRSDVKHSSWFRMEHSVAIDPEWDHFQAAEKWIWVFLMSIASLKNRGVLEISAEQIAARNHVETETVLSSIQKLKEKGCVKLTLRGRTANGTRTVRERIATDGRTDETDGRDGHNEQTLGFAALYKKYPRKIEPQAATKRCAEVIKSVEDYESLSKAIDRYAVYCKREKTPQKFIKHMSTFVENRESKPYTQPWRDWLDPDTGKDVSSGTGFHRGEDLDQQMNDLLGGLGNG